ncbi:MAG: hypothetical protein J3R72DRAFT_69871 [Linnemannia gamsii]|nr:MAG: hypothetical protein J3R72DRAFT_69871 [Linnemannia gamsii]
MRYQRCRSSRAVQKPRSMSCLMQRLGRAARNPSLQGQGIFLANWKARSKLAVTKDQDLSNYINTTTCRREVLRTAFESLLDDYDFNYIGGDGGAFDNDHEDDNNRHNVEWDSDDGLEHDGNMEDGAGIDIEDEAGIDVEDDEVPSENGAVSGDKRDDDVRSEGEVTAKNTSMDNCRVEYDVNNDIDVESVTEEPSFKAAVVAMMSAEGESEGEEIPDDNGNSEDKDSSRGIGDDRGADRDRQFKCCDICLPLPEPSRQSAITKRFYVKAPSREHLAEATKRLQHWRSKEWEEYNKTNPQPTQTCTSLMSDDALKRLARCCEMFVATNSLFELTYCTWRLSAECEEEVSKILVDLNIEFHRNNASKEKVNRKAKSNKAKK